LTVRNKTGGEEGEDGDEDKAASRDGRLLNEFNMMMTSSAFGVHNARMSSPSLKRYAWLSICAALTTILLKGLAWRITGSVGLLSDALESVVNLAGAMMALAMITIAEQPADDQHAYGHGKAEYFSAGFEGLLILLAAIGIGVAAIERLRNPQPLEQLGVGLAVSVVASIVNLLAARILLAAGRKHRSMTLEADAHHLMADVWTSAGVITGVAAVALTGWLWLDPLLALLVALNIVWTGWKLLRRSTEGLMDVALPPAEHALVLAVLERYRRQGIDYHALRTRESGARRFVELHVLVPGEWTIQHGHELAERLESDIRSTLPHTTVLTHLEPLDDPVSQEDIELDR
jgi:cation diffusion facilitator family transporter